MQPACKTVNIREYTMTETWAFNYYACIHYGDRSNQLATCTFHIYIRIYINTHSQACNRGAGRVPYTLQVQSVQVSPQPGATDSIRDLNYV